MPLKIKYSKWYNEKSADETINIIKNNGKWKGEEKHK